MTNTKTSAAKKTKKRAIKKSAKKTKKTAKAIKEEGGRRRGVTAKRKAGVHRDYGKEPTGENRRKRKVAKKHKVTDLSSKRGNLKSRGKAGMSPEPEYRNIEKSERAQRTWDGDTRAGAWKDEVGVQGGRSDKKYYKTRGRDQEEPKRRRRQIIDERSGRKPRHDPYYYSRPRRRKRLARTEGWRKFYRVGPDGQSGWTREGNPFGEHPESRGRAEYIGGNKRHPGLLGYQGDAGDYGEGFSHADESRGRARETGSRYRIPRRRERKREQALNHKTSTRLAIEDYINRRQYETPFHAMQMYDPVESEYERQELAEHDETDHMYHDEGYQHAGNTTGFGHRIDRGHHDWLEEDEYREGHTPRKKGSGKFGSR